MSTRGVNKHIIVGNLGADPEVRYTQSGSPVVSLRVATSKKWKDKQTGDLREKTEWHRCVLFNRLAEIGEKYLKKGSQVYLEGEVTTRKWQGQDGQDRYTTETVCNEMQMLGGASGSNGNQSRAAPPQQGGGYHNGPGPAQAPGNGGQDAPQYQPPPEALGDDDIPF